MHALAKICVIKVDCYVFVGGLGYMVSGRIVQGQRPWVRLVNGGYDGLGSCCIHRGRHEGALWHFSRRTKIVFACSDPQHALTIVRLEVEAFLRLHADELTFCRVFAIAVHEWVLAWVCMDLFSDLLERGACTLNCQRI